MHCAFSTYNSYFKSLINHSLYYALFFNIIVISQKGLSKSQIAPFAIVYFSK